MISFLFVYRWNRQFLLADEAVFSLIRIGKLVDLIILLVNSLFGLIPIGRGLL